MKLIEKVKTGLSIEAFVNRHVVSDHQDQNGARTTTAVQVWSTEHQKEGLVPRRASKCRMKEATPAGHDGVGSLLRHSAHFPAAEFGHGLAKQSPLGLATHISTACQYHFPI
jgi:hypothetical protein